MCKTLLGVCPVAIFSLIMSSIHAYVQFTVHSRRDVAFELALCLAWRVGLQELKTHTNTVMQSAPKEGICISPSRLRCLLVQVHRRLSDQTSERGSAELRSKFSVYRQTHPDILRPWNRATPLHINPIHVQFFNASFRAGQICSSWRGQMPVHLHAR